MHIPRTAIILFLLLAAADARPVYVIPVNGMIDLGLAPYIERVLHEAEQRNAAAVILQVNTFGGRVDAAVRIKDALLNTPLPTYAFVDKRAISAGALISLSTDTVIMAGGSSIGAVTPVDGQGKKLSEKQVSYMRAEMRATAERQGRPPLISEAMVDESISIDSMVAAGRLLTLTADEAIRCGIADLRADTIEEILEKTGRAGSTIIRTAENWAEKLVRFLSHPAVSSLLMTIGMLGVIFEVKTPGWGIGGTVGILALALFFGSQYLVQLAGWEELLLFAAGTVLMLLELFVIPGFGITGILGITAIAAALVLSLLGHLPTRADLATALAAVIGAFALTVLVTATLFRKLPGTGPFNRLVLTGTVTGGTPPRTAEQAVSAGCSGTAASDLRPSGTAIFNNERIDVVTEGDYIEKGSSVRVTEVHGNRIVVRKLT